jgi:hypothetical protein
MELRLKNQCKPQVACKKKSRPIRSEESDAADMFDLYDNHAF